jgi:hypothetical protein
VKANRAQQRIEEPEAEFPPLALEPPSLAAVPPLEEPEPGSAAHEASRRPRTARAEYRDSEMYQPLSSLLLGGRKVRIALLVVLFIAYNAAMAALAFDAVGSSPTSDDRTRVVAVVFGGLMVGLLVALMEHRYRLGRRFTFKG